MSEIEAGDCGCVYTGADAYDCPEFEHREVRKARKPHKCCECRETIPVGAQYQRDSGKWEGKFRAYVTCLPCAEIRESLCCDGWIFTQLWEDVTESLFPNMTTGCLEKLTTAAAKEKLLQEWNNWKFQ